MNTKQTLQNELRSIEIESGYLSDFINVEDFSQDAEIYKYTTDEEFKEEIYNMLDSEGAFYVEIMYYNNAIDYLRREDFSLTISLELANDAGYKLTDLTSEILASLLASENCRDNFLEMPPKDFGKLRIALASHLETLTAN
jgi:hypothetical protein